MHACVHACVSAWAHTGMLLAKYIHVHICTHVSATGVKGHINQAGAGVIASTSQAEHVLCTHVFGCTHTCV